MNLHEIRDLRSFSLGQNEHLPDGGSLGIGILSSGSKFNILSITTRSSADKLGNCKLKTCHTNKVKKNLKKKNSLK